VKVRGFRVEPGEIEARLLEFPGIKEAVVMVKQGEEENSGQYLCAYIAGEPLEDPQPLREHLTGILPYYMVPDRFVALEEMPLTGSGKIDRRALTELKETRLGKRATYVAPSNRVQSLVAETWKEVLGTDAVGIHDNFFDLGGNSFDIIKANSRIETALDREVPIVKLFKYPTVIALANYLEHGEPGDISEEQVAAITEKKDKGKNRLKERGRRGKKGI
jgi:polyketide synthase PksN